MNMDFTVYITYSGTVNGPVNKEGDCTRKKRTYVDWCYFDSRLLLQPLCDTLVCI